MNKECQETRERLALTMKSISKYEWKSMEFISALDDYLDARERAAHHAIASEAHLESSPRASRRA